VADVLDGMKEMFTRTQFAVDQGGYFPEIKVLYPLTESNCSLSVQVSPGTQHSIPQMPTPLHRRFQALSILGLHCSVYRYSVHGIPGKQSVRQVQSTQYPKHALRYPALGIPGTQDPSYPTLRIIGFQQSVSRHTDTAHKEPNTL
jgi:hypothetical protein